MRRDCTAVCKKAVGRPTKHHTLNVASMGPINALGCIFLFKLSCKLAGQLGDNREISFLFQRLTVLIQRYNAILLHDSFVKMEEK